MKTITEKLSPALLQYPIELIGPKEDLLFVDIETTGFSARSSVLYLIGCLYFEDEQPVLTQFFATSPSKEEKVLSAFLSLCRSKKILLHYNGNNFDLPFIRHKCQTYGFKVPFDDMKGVDIYKRVMPYKRILGVENLKQKTMETFLDISREDAYDGGELINIYREFVTADTLQKKQQAAGISVSAEEQMRLSSMQELLLLHNADDMRGMLRMLGLLSYSEIFLQPLRITRVSAKKITDPSGGLHQSLIIRLKLASPLPKPLSVSNRGCLFMGDGIEGTLEIPILTGELKYFYGNYKEYYYLPEEDMALHKSVASYVSPEHRQQATAQTCYTRKEGSFLPQWDLLFEPVFRSAYGSELLFFELTEEMKKSPDAFRQYAYHILDFLFHDKIRS